MSIQPRYKFDPVTQRYTLLNPQEIAQRNVQEQGGIRSFDSYPSYPSYPESGGDAAPAPDGSYSMSPETAVGMQNFGLAMQGVPTIGAQVVGSVVGGIPSAYGYATPTPVDNPVAPVETAIAPTMGLAAMNAQVAAEDEAETQAAQVANIASAISDVATQNAAQQAQASPEAAVAAAAPADVGVSDVGGSAMGDSGAGVGDVGGGGSSDGGGDGGGDSGSSSSSGGGTDTGAADSGWRQGGIVMNYAQGGMAPQNYGRMGDSMLVHMNPREVAGLQALARSRGTSMTVNPVTGYPEAFNLSALLPIIAGAALGPAGLGLTAAQAGLATAALGTAATGSLSKGIQAGLGAYGGAGIGEGLAGAASSTPTVPGMEGAAAGSSGIPGATTPVTSPTLPANPYSIASPAGTTTPFGITPQVGMPTGLETTGLTGSTATPFPPASDLYSMSATPGGSGLTTSPMQATTAQTAGLTTTPSPGPFANMSGKDMFKYGSAAAAPLLGEMAQPIPAGAPARRATFRPYDFSYNPVTSSYESRPGDSSERIFLEPTFTPRETYTARSGGQVNAYAGGGLTAFKEGGRPKGRPLMDDKDLGGIGFYEMMGEGGSNLSSVEKNFAKGGMPPRFLSGGGDGMSDDIPAVIGDKQPARLADGEFVIPADVVSHIGNGSSKAGAKKLYEMMAEIRKSRTGKTKQAPAIKPEKYMPA
jgi:hypothetical protein